MAKQPNEPQTSDITLIIEEATTIIIDGVEYKGTVTVDTTTAQTLKQTGKVDEDGNTTNA